MPGCWNWQTGRSQKPVVRKDRVGSIPSPGNNKFRQEIYMKRILVIDDDKAFSELMKDFFTDQGYMVQCAYTGEEGLKVVKAFNPDVIFLDVMMPGMYGIEVLRHLKEDEKTYAIPVIILTGSNFDFSMKDLFKQEGNCKGFLNKTVELSRIEQELANIFCA